MSSINYQVVYDITGEIGKSFDMVDYIVSAMFVYFFIFAFWKITTEGKYKKAGTTLSILFFLFVFFGVVRNYYDSLIPLKTALVEGEVHDYRPASYYNRRGGDFYVKGVKFKTSIHGIDKEMGTPINFKNGRKVKIVYEKETHKLLKFEIEKYAIVLERLCADNNYTACFQASRKYQHKNKTKAKKLLLKSLDSNKSDYFFMVAKLYEHGILFDKNQTKAFEFYEKSDRKNPYIPYNGKERVKIKLSKKREENKTFDILDIMD